MDLTYQLKWDVEPATYDKFWIAVANNAGDLATEESPVKVDFSAFAGDVDTIANSAKGFVFDIPVFRTPDGKVKVFLSDIMKQDFDSAQLYTSSWKEALETYNKTITEPSSQLTTEVFFDKIKNNTKNLYTILKNVSNYESAFDNALSDNTKFLSIVAVIHTLEKVVVKAYVSLTVANTSTCSIEGRKLNKQSKLDEYNRLVSLLRDTTRILLNIDSIPDKK
jgi:hypothetical protein